MRLLCHSRPEYGPVLTVRKILGLNMVLSYRQHQAVLLYFIISVVALLKIMCRKVLTNSVSVLCLSVGHVRNISYSNYFRFKILALLGWTLEYVLIYALVHALSLICVCFFQTGSSLLEYALPTEFLKSNKHDCPSNRNQRINHFILLNATATVTLVNVTVRMYIEGEGFGGKYDEILGNWGTNIS